MNYNTIEKTAELSVAAVHRWMPLVRVCKNDGHPGIDQTCLGTLLVI